MDTLPKTPDAPLDLPVSSRHYLLLTAVLVLAGMVYLLGNDRIALWDRDEPRFAQASREMIQRQDYIVPHFNGTYRFDKPVLVYWLMVANYRLFGTGDFAARFGSSLSGLLACGLLYFFAARLFNRRLALWATAIMAAFPLFIIETKLATADALLSVFLVAALGLWLMMQAQRPRWYQAVLLGLALGLGTLTKGPVIWLFLGVAVLISFIRRIFISTDRRHLLSLRNLAFALLTLAVAAAVFLPWGLAALSQTKGAFWTEGVSRHVVQRSTESLEDHWGPPGYYFAAWLVCAFPWSVFAPLALVQAWRRARQDWRMAALLAWIIGPWLILELVQTKLVHYALGCYPALAILIAILLDDLTGRLKTKLLGRMALSALWIIGIGLAGVMIVGVVVLCTGPLAQFGSYYDLLFWGVLAGLVVLATSLIFRRGLIRGNPSWAVAYGFVGVMIWMFLVAGFISPAISRYRISPQAASVARQLSPTGTRFVLYGFDEPSLIWYLDAGQPVRIARTSDDLVAAYRSDDPVCVIVAEDKMDRLFRSSDPGQWVTGLYLNDFRPLSLWIAPNKAARAARPN
ncbi:MAG: phospholipid carrier-dependent glycosyltransferase [Actinobacteria bacterium]|nr:phospholipid carrier-dependent glycosyltransferase [Actinomycetota bacterium]